MGLGRPAYIYDGGLRRRTCVDAAQRGVCVSRRAPAGPLPATVAGHQTAAGTNVQEAGVDEPDVVKTDGALLVRVEDGDLVTYDVTGAEPERWLDARPAGAREPRSCWSATGWS